MLIRDAGGAEFGRGLVAYDADDARSPGAIRANRGILGTPGRAALIHRDDMVLKGD